MASQKDTGNTTGQMSLSSKGSLKTDSAMAKEFGKEDLELMILMKGSISVIKNVETEHSHGLQEISIKVAISTI